MSILEPRRDVCARASPAALHSIELLLDPEAGAGNKHSKTLGSHVGLLEAARTPSSGARWGMSGNQDEGGPRQRRRKKGNFDGAGRLIFESADAFRFDWRVTGPRKQGWITNRFRREPGPDE